MEFNPFANSYNKLNEQIIERVEKRKKTQHDLEWYGSVNILEFEKNLKQTLAMIGDKEKEISQVDSAVSTLNSIANDLKSKLEPWYNPLRWFSKEQIRLKKEYESIEKKLVSESDRKTDYIKAVQELIDYSTTLKSNIYRYNGINVDDCNDSLKKLDSELSNLQIEFEPIAANKNRVDKELEQIVNEINEMLNNKKIFEINISKAKQYRTELKNANGAYERRLIHQKCEEEFDDGNPNRIIVRDENKLRQLDKDLQKAEKRAIIIGRIAARTIDTVIIDGNNMCYEGDRFVGLHPVKITSIELVNKKIIVIVVFDSDIRSLMKSNDAQIYSQFIEDVKVHIVATKQKADETILELASKKKTAYIISNDRFGDYNDKEVVKNGRIIRHEIVNGQILIHELKINTPYITPILNN